MKKMGLTLGAALCLAAASGSAGEADWMTDADGVLDIKVALSDQGGACGASLMLDRNKQTLVLEGAPGEVGCKLKLEAAFDEVKSVKTGEGAGFLVELKKGKQKKLLMIPVTHVQWLLTQPLVSGNFGQSMANSGLRGPDGEPMRVGGSAGSVGPQVKKVELPKDVMQDTEKAANAVLSALGRGDK